MKAPQLATLSAMAECVGVAPEQVVFGSGERSRYFYLLVSGTMSLELQTPVYTVCIQHLHGGEAFGWSALVDKPYRAFQIRAREASLVIRLRGDRLKKACKRDERLGAAFFPKVAAMVAVRLRATESRLIEFLGSSAVQGRAS
ncbi:MAG: cyclic nucleotide-binding domain-containing protein [Acidobacteria bacterium]|nr:cyclic nucleotide-binding domain-containing protein [Acidobacteriota bacterium]